MTTPSINAPSASRRGFLSVAAGLAGLAGIVPVMATANENMPAARGAPAPSVAAIEHRIAHDGHMIYARDYPGHEPAFVLLHGFPDNLHIYDYLLPLLTAAGRRVVVFDFVGFGDSDKVAQPGYYSFSQQVGDLAAVANALKLDKFIPVGHDSGGPCAANYALDNPRRVAWVCLMNTYYADTPTLRFPELIELFGDPSLKALAGAIASDREKMAWLISFQNKAFQVNMPPDQRQRFDGILQPIIDANFAGGSGPAFMQMVSQVRGNVAYNSGRVARARKFEPKVKLIWGALDPYLTPDAANAIAANFAHASVRLVQAGHWLMIDLPEQVANLLLEGA